MRLLHLRHRGAAAALLEDEPDADADRVAEALERNLCRCGAQRRIIDAVLAAREPGDATSPPTSSPTRGSAPG